MDPLYSRLQQLCLLAYHHQASDIHIQQRDKQISLFMRALTGFVKIPSLEIDVGLLEFCKFTALCDGTLRHLPQSGSFEIHIKENTLFCRFSIIETYHAKSGVIRLLNSIPIQHIEELTHQKSAITQLKKAIQYDFGLILFAGSTGSGKSTTMFTLLNTKSDKRIFTLEDPIERQYQPLMQLSINHKQGLTFQSGLTHLLRHDPDIIVFGEIRDGQAAKAAISAAYTGHLVISTIHSSSLTHTIGRLLDLSVSAYDIKQVVQQIIYQKLVLNDDKKRRSASYEFCNNDQIKQLC